MNFLIENLGISKQTLIYIGIFIAAAISSFGINMWRQKRRKKEKEQYAAQRKREEVLNKALANPHTASEQETFEKHRRPFKVEYSMGDEENAGKGSGRMYQLTEITELSQRNYMFHCEELVSIGDQFGTVMILPRNAEEKQICCHIFFYQNENYLRSTGKIEVILKRGRKQAIVNRSGLKLRSGDQFTIGKTMFSIEFL